MSSEQEQQYEPFEMNLYDETRECLVPTNGLVENQKIATQNKFFFFGEGKTQIF